MNAMMLWRVGGCGVMMCVTGLACWAAAERRSAQSMPAQRRADGMSLEEALAKRRSVRDFREEPLTDQQIAQLCWAAQGVTDKRSGKRTCPSAGALYPLELRVVTREGVCRYIHARHGLVEQLKGDLRGKLAAAALRQRWIKEAPAVFVITAVVSRTEKKYGDRAARYVHMEAGHAGQNLLLQAVSLGLAAVPVGAFDDRAVAKVLTLPVGETPLYLIPVGLQAKRSAREQ